MLPLRDNLSTSSTPYVTIALIALNILIFLGQKSGNSDLVAWKFGFVPAKLLQTEEGFAGGLRGHPPTRPMQDAYGRILVDRWGRAIPEIDRSALKAAVAMPAWITLLTCMFLHGGWMHLLGNMLYLWIFGNNIEDRLGSVLFVVFYLGTGVVGSLAHAYFDAGYIPLVGASGAISGVMGAYILLFPRARIQGIMPIGWYPLTISLPAWMFLGIYFLIQNLYPAYFTAQSAGGGGVAYWAHTGGFVSGAALILIFPHRQVPPVARPVYDPARDDADIVL